MHETPLDRDIKEGNVEKMADARVLTRGKRSKMMSSPYYQEFLSKYNEMAHDPEFSIAKFYKTVVAPKDASITFPNVQFWVARMKRVEKVSWAKEIQQMAASALDPKATVEQIRDTSQKIFLLKVTQFLQHPEMLEAMNFNQAMQLYKNIEQLNIATERLKIDQKDSFRKDVFTIFSMGLLAGKYKDSDVENLLTKPTNVIDVNGQGAATTPITESSNIGTVA